MELLNRRSKNGTMLDKTFMTLQLYPFFPIK